jgi:hypothetical protein
MKEKSDLVIAGLVRHGSRERAAREAGIGLTTLKRWLHDHDFCAAYAEAKREAHEEAMEALMATRLRAVEKLAALMEDPDSPPALQRQCAVDLLTHARTVSEEHDILTRLAKIEVAQELRQYEFDTDDD